MHLIQEKYSVCYTFACIKTSSISHNAFMCYKSAHCSDTNQIKIQPNTAIMGDARSHLPKWNRITAVATATSQPSYHCHHSAMQWVVLKVRLVFFSTHWAHNELAMHYNRERLRTHFLVHSLFFFNSIISASNGEKKNENRDKYGFVIKCYKNNNNNKVHSAHRAKL